MVNRQPSTQRRENLGKPMKLGTRDENSHLHTLSHNIIYLMWQFWHAQFKDSVGCMVCKSLIVLSLARNASLSGVSIYIYCSWTCERWSMHVNLPCASSHWWKFICCMNAETCVICKQLSQQTFKGNIYLCMRTLSATTDLSSLLCVSLQLLWTFEYIRCTLCCVWGDFWA